MASSSTKYTTNLEPGVLNAVSEELEKKQQKQKIHTFYLQHLQSFIKELPSTRRAKFPDSFLMGIANSLVDGTVFEIVSGLEEIQEIAERNLFQQRLQTVQRMKGQKQDMESRHKDQYQKCQAGRPHHIPILQAAQIKEKQKVSGEHEEEMRRMDMKVIRDLDQLVSEQQLNLEKAGVPGFYVTNNPQEIQIQMYVLKFIRDLRYKEPPPHS